MNFPTNLTQPSPKSTNPTCSKISNKLTGMVANEAWPKLSIQEQRSRLKPITVQSTELSHKATTRSQALKRIHLATCL
jgi:hypothetical protein